jgi:2-oxoglutarate dehydrogenase complex dehydrogenase (E1) component-like enzyme
MITWQRVGASPLLLAGINSADPRHIVLWEAQFGDFANVAQPIH